MSGIPKIGFEVSASAEFKAVLDQVQQVLAGLPAHLQGQLTHSGNQALNRPGGSAPAPNPAPLPPPRPPDDPEEKNSARYRDGEQLAEGSTAAVAGDVQADASELKSGGFSGIIDRRYQGGKSAVMTASAVKERAKESERRRRDREKRREDYKERKEAWERMAGGLGPGGTMPGGSAAGGQGGRYTIRDAKFERVELTPSAARILARTLARHGLKGGGSGGGRGGAGGGAGGPGPGGAAGDSVQGVGSTLPVVGAIMGLAGMAMRFGSALSQMYQQAMESQDSTLGVFGYVGGGGGYVRNSELAQIQLSRARMSEDGNTRGFLKNTGGDALDIRYGLSQGIGGSHGAQIAGQLNRYGSQKLTEREFGKVINAGEAAGYGGVRNAEFTERIAGMLRQSYEGGYGALDASDTAHDVAALRKRGLRPQNALTVMENTTRGFQSEGNLLQSLAVAGGMRSGKSYMQSLVQAEQGATATNRSAAVDLLGLDKMNPEMRALIESRVLKVGTATQAMTANQNGRGGLLSGLEKESVASSGQTFAAVNKPGLARQYVATANSIEQTIAGSEVAQGAHKLQGKIVNGMITAYEASESVMMGFVDGMGTMNKKISELSSSIEGLLNKLDFFG